MKLSSTLFIGGTLALFLVIPSTARAADPAGTGAASPGKAPVTGTVEGEVKKVEPGAVVVEKEKDGAEVRLPLNESTHKGEVKEGDKVEAFVTPGGTTTSVQPRKEGLNR